MAFHGPRHGYLCEQVKLVVDYCFVFSIAHGAWVVASILLAKLLRRPFIRLPIPGARRKIRLRTNSSDIGTYNQVFIRREYDFWSLPQGQQFYSEIAAIDDARRPIAIVDCGANVGCTALWFATEFPGAEIVAIEPDVRNCELLHQNAGGLKNVRIIRAALWSTETEVVISNPDADPWAFRTEAIAPSSSPQMAPIATVTMDHLLANHAPSTKLIVKIDIEGAEREVFAKNTSWLQSVDLLMIELHDNLFPGQGSAQSFFAAVSSKPLDYVWRGENLFCFQRREADWACHSQMESTQQ